MAVALISSASTVSHTCWRRKDGRPPPSTHISSRGEPPPALLPLLLCSSLARHAGSTNVSAHLSIARERASGER